METDQAGLKTYLQDELTRRCRKNGGYSLRSFARSLQMNPSTLSQILRGKRKLTMKTALEICERLNMPFSGFQTSEGRSSVARKHLKQLAEDAFNIISDWYHHALLELPRIKKNEKIDPQWAAKTLGISVGEVHAAVERLQRVGLLKIEEEGQWIVSSPDNSSLGAYETTSAARRRLQIQILDLARKAVEEVPVENRKNVSVTLAFHSAQLPKAKELIDQFREDFASKMDQGSSYNHIYNLAIAFYPVTKKSEKEVFS